MSKLITQLGGEIASQRLACIKIVKHLAHELTIPATQTLAIDIDLDRLREGIEILHQLKCNYESIKQQAESTGELPASPDKA